VEWTLLGADDDDAQDAYYDSDDSHFTIKNKQNWQVIGGQGRLLINLCVFGMFLEFEMIDNV
jgi:hypothetical protein